MAIMLTETLLVIKFSQGQYPEPHPRPVLTFWALLVAFLVGFPIVKVTIG
jgi:hypothetical protein